MTRSVFISYDFGLKGDYDNLYKWLDEKKAEERGYGLAYIKDFFIHETFKKDNEFFLHIREELQQKLKLGNSDRIYMIWGSIESDRKTRSGFLIGKPKQAPWTGFSNNNMDDFLLDL